MDGRQRWTGAWRLAGLCALLASLAAAAPARAQGSQGSQGSPPGYGPPPRAARDDVEWEERRVSYGGGPIRPGGQLEGSTSGFVWLGVGGFAGGFVLSTLIGVANDRSYAAIPLVGPWMAVGNAFGDREPWPSGAIAATVIGGLLQPAGIAFFIGGLLSPNLYVVYDAPVGRPSPFEAARLRWAPGAPGAEVGVSLALEVF